MLLNTTVGVASAVTEREFSKRIDGGGGGGGGGGEEEACSPSGLIPGVLSV